MNTAIVVAAGGGKRFGGDTPKQFLEIAGKPLVVHTLLLFENCWKIDEIILVLPSAYAENFKSVCDRFDFKKPFRIISGGETRAESVFNGLSIINSETAGVVAIHDGARPLVSIDEICATVEKAEQTGAACLVAPVTDTIKEISGDRILRTVDRTQLRRALTPQCFRYEILRRAFENDNLSETATDESFLVEQFGITVSLVKGSPRNIKITHPEDFTVAEILLKQI